MGLLISTFADSQQVAFQAALLSSFLPTIMLSGFIFPIAGMPKALQVVTYVVPARYFLVALRAVVLKGVGFDVVAAVGRGAGDLRHRGDGPRVRAAPEGVVLTCGGSAT